MAYATKSTINSLIERIYFRGMAIAGGEKIHHANQLLRKKNEKKLRAAGVPTG